MFKRRTKFRIIENGFGSFVVQERDFLFWDDAWFLCRKIRRQRLALFDNFDDAKSCLDALVELDAKHRAKPKVRFVQ